MTMLSNEKNITNAMKTLATK